MMLYRVAKKPDGPFGMMMFLLMGRAGDGALIGDWWYHFRQWFFVKDRKETLMRKPGYYISPVREATAADIQRFEAAIGKPWGWRHNCLTEITARLTGGQ